MPDLQKLRVLMGLSKLSGQTTSDVLRDAGIRTKIGGAISRPIGLADTGVVVNREVLFSAFRDAADGLEPKPLVDESDVVLDAKVLIDEDGAGIVETGAYRLRFPHAALLASFADRRRAAVASALSQLSLATKNASALTDLVSQTDFSHDDFLRAVDYLSATPESLARLLQETTSRGGLSEADLLPGDVHYWENLTASIDGSASLSEYLAGELLAERRARLTNDPIQGFRSIAPTFCSSSLIPREILREIEVDTTIRMLEGVLDGFNCFSLSGAFEICAERVGSDPRFVDIGSRLLDLLFDDMERLRDRCKYFATAFAIATAHLAVHESLRERPVYWRRLAAASHSSIVAHAFDSANLDASSLQKWAYRMRGREYLISVLRDMVIEPQWRPEWADSGFVAADIFGRAYATFGKLPESAALESWHDRIERAKAWVDRNELSPLMYYPTVVEGSRRSPNPAMAELEAPFADVYSRLSNEPTIENLLRITPLVEMFGVHSGVTADTRSVLQQIKIGDMDDDRLTAVLSLSAHIAVLANDAVLSDMVAEIWLDKARIGLNQRTLHEAVFRLIECAATNPDRAAARSTLAQRLETLAFVLPPTELLTDLVDLLESLGRVDTDMVCLLGRAVHTAKLAMPRSDAA